MGTSHPGLILLIDMLTDAENYYYTAPNGGFRKALCFSAASILFLFLQREISEVPRSIAAKFCHIIVSMFSFIIPV